MLSEVPESSSARMKIASAFLPGSAAGRPDRGANATICGPVPLNSISFERIVNLKPLVKMRAFGPREIFELAT
jgi:hypothetical protein